MSVYNLLQNQAVTSVGPNPQGQIVNPPGPVLPTAPTTQQTFELVITGTAGSVSGTAQVVSSNDGINWITYGAPIVVASSYLTGAAGLSGAQSWTFFGAYLTAISGVGATATLKMSA